MIVMQQQYNIKIRPTYHLRNWLKDKAADTEWNEPNEYCLHIKS